MKQQALVVITKVEIDGEDWPLIKPENIELEFSAIDTGGGFHDPILDFTYELEVEESDKHIAEGTHQIKLYLQDPSDADNTLNILYEGALNWVDDNRLEGMGRLKDKDMSREIVKFVFRSVRR